MAQICRRPALARAVACTLAICLVSLSLVPAFGSYVRSESTCIQEPAVKLPDGTEFEVSTIEEISSKTATEGDPLTFKVVEDVKINGQVVISKDSLVKGTVSNSQKSGRMGKSGRLGIRVESTNSVDGQKVRLRASKGKEGDDKTGSVIALSILVSPLFLLKHGKDAKIKPGTKIKVYTDEEVNLKPKL